MEKILERHLRIGRRTLGVVVRREELDVRMLLSHHRHPAVPFLGDVRSRKTRGRHRLLHRSLKGLPTVPIVVEGPVLLGAGVVVVIRLVADLEADKFRAQRLRNISCLGRGVLRRAVPQVQSVDDTPADRFNEVIQVADRERRENRSRLGGSAGVGTNRSGGMVLRGIGVIVAPGGVLLGVAADAQHALRTPSRRIKRNQLRIVLRRRIRDGQAAPTHSSAR